MKRILNICLVFIICFGLVGCGKEKTTLEKLNGFMTIDENSENFFAYIPESKKDYTFTINYEPYQEEYNCLMMIIVDNETLYYSPNKNKLLINIINDGTFVCETDIHGSYSLDDDTLILDRSYYPEFSDISDDVMEFLSLIALDDFKNKVSLEEVKTQINFVKEKLQENDLSFEDIDVPFDELDK